MPRGWEPKLRKLRDPNRLGAADAQQKWANGLRWESRSVQVVAHSDFMASPPIAPEKMNRAVVAYRDGRRLKGYILNFSALKEKFRLFSSEPGKQQSGVDVSMNDLKAIFFVKDFEGDASYTEARAIEAPKHRRRLTVTFADG